MAIKRIKVSNFKSFKDLDIELGDFTVLIGANASGKSNFTQVFRFIRDIIKEGIDNAISMQGTEYLTYIGVPFPKTLSLSCTSEFKSSFGFRVSESVAIEMIQATHDFALKFEKPSGDFEIEKDELNFKIDYVDWEKRRKNNKSKAAVLGSGNIIFCNDKGQIKTKIKKSRAIKISSKEIFPPFFMGRKLPSKTILLQTQPLFVGAEMSVGEIGLYDFEPKLSKKAVPIAGKFELDEDGSNLSLVLKGVVENSDNKRKFSNLMKDLLPFVEDLSTDKFADKSLLFKLKEKFFPDIYFPASFISDGTVNISALLSALYFERKSVIIIEEPERNIHPHLISRMMEMMKDASKNKQIIVTTHSPEVVKHAGVENLLLVSRDRDGFSIISRPSEKEEVKIFLQNELGLDDVFVQNLWGE